MNDNEEMTPESESPVPQPETTVDAEAAMRRISRRSFLWAGAAAAGAIGGWTWLTSRGKVDEIPWPLRRALELNERLNRGYFRSARLSATYPAGMATEPRTNGDLGMMDEIDLASWELKLEGAAAGVPAKLTMDYIRRLHRVDIVTDLRCIEGWSNIVHWTGARFSDFLAKYPPATRSGMPADAERPEELPQYVALSTPDDGYYVGLDMAAALHPQTLLCYEMNGEPLTSDHGAPLRLVIPVRYGVKNIKRIGTIRYTDQRPPDYWAEQGYDWYAGL